jgi:hypothetical protein
VVSFLGVVLGGVLGLFGLFPVWYPGEEGSEGDTYVNFGGTHVDADLLGISLMIVAVPVLAVSLRALRRS